MQRNQEATPSNDALPQYCIALLRPERFPCQTVMAAPESTSEFGGGGLKVAVVVRALCPDLSRHPRTEESLSWMDGCRHVEFAKLSKARLRTGIRGVCVCVCDMYRTVHRGGYRCRWFFSQVSLIVLDLGTCERTHTNITNTVTTTKKKSGATRRKVLAFPGDWEE